MHLVGVTECLEETTEILLRMVGAPGLHVTVGYGRMGCGNIGHEHTPRIPGSRRVDTGGAPKP
eukprot:7001337-Ditylum_brightwellii.AAC.1